MTSPKFARPLPREEANVNDEITIERRTRKPRPDGVPSQAITRRVPVVDSWLIAIARGDVDPADEDDPFGGLIPVDDDGNEIF